MVAYTDSWLPLPVEDYQEIQNSLVQYAYNDAASYIGQTINFVVSFLSFILNGLVIAVILRSKNIRSSNSGLLSFQLAFTDFIHAIIFVGYPITYFIRGQLTVSVETCFVATVLSGYTSGVWTMTFALSALDRYMTIVRQITFPKFQLALLMALILIASTVITLLPVYIQHHSYFKVRISGIYCGYAFYDHAHGGTILSVASLIYLAIPNQAISSFYSSIIKSYVAVRIQSGRFTIDGKQITDPKKLTLWQTYKLINDMGQRNNMTYSIRSDTNLASRNSMEISEPRLSSRQRMELLVFRKCVTTFVVFNICWLPLTITAIYEVISGTQVSRTVDSIVTICATASGSVNAYLNFSLDERFKTELREMLGYKN